MKEILIGFTAAAFLSLGGGICFAEEVVVTPPIILKANDILPEKAVKGTNYTIDNEVQNDGLINTYRLTTNYGITTVESTSQLMMRIGELKALEAMEEVDRKGVFGDALVKGVKAPVETVVDLVQEPVETSTNIVKGAGRFLSNIGNSIISDDPNQDNALKVALGYDVAKRQFAFEFGIDPYTTYEPVVDRLGEIARAGVAGGIAPKAALAAIDTDLTTALRVSGAAKGLKELVRDKAPSELHKINMAKMQAMGISAELTDVFLNNYNYNPQEETLLVGELETMKEVKGLETFFSVASAVTERKVAVFYRFIAQMMAGYNAHVAPVEQIVIIDGTLHVKTQSGLVVLISSVDYLFWTAKVKEKMNRLDEQIGAMAGVNGKELWISGEIDTNAKEMFARRKWKVVDNANTELIK